MVLVLSCEKTSCYECRTDIKVNGNVIQTIRFDLCDVTPEEVEDYIRNNSMCPTCYTGQKTQCHKK